MKLAGKKILVTGATGFTGSHCVEMLIQNGAHVIGSYRHLNSPSYFSTTKLEKKIQLVQCDFRNYSQVQQLFDTHNIEYVIHFAAQGSIPKKADGMLEMIDSNVMGVANLLEVVRKKGNIKGVMLASSDKAYGKSKRTFVETDPVGGDHPYEVTKAAGDLLAMSYYKTFGVPIVVVRATNLYGPGDAHMERIVPSIMHAAITKTPVILRSNGKFVRDYLYVKDVVLAYKLLLTHFSDTVGNVYNVSSNDTYSVLQLIKKIEKILATSIEIQVLATAKNEIPYLHLSSKKIQQLGWKQETKLEQAIQETYEWYKKQ